jgi:phosphomannomutase/phosphoglucomutase
MAQIDPSIFKAYDIRGVVGRNLNAEVFRAIGVELGHLSLDAGVGSFVIARDGRHSGPELCAALAQGLEASGVEVIDIGQVTTPMLYFATHEVGAGSGAAVTGSHNPPDYNGLKMVVAGATLHGEAIQDLYQRIFARQGADHGPLPRLDPTGQRSVDVSEAYLRRIVGDIRLARPMKIAVDCGNGVAGAFAPGLYRRLGCAVVELFCEVDGSFPNHHPDPADPHNLESLVACLRNTDCEIGLAFDGDGDRLGVVTKSGKIIWPDRQLMLFARDVLTRNPGAEIIFDVKCSRHVARVIEAAGGVARMSRTGHSLIKARLKETGAPLAGEMSGHMFFKERWYGFDDGLYAGARLLEIVSREPAWIEAAGAAVSGASQVLEILPNSPSTPELKLQCAEGENFRIVEALASSGAFANALRLITIDGVRAEYPEGFGLARASNTTPVVVIRFEADDQAALERIQEEFRGAFARVDSRLQLPF